jgi:ABC-type multidrug transport system fused ATPase/permease subunit
LQATGDADFTMKAFGAAMDLARYKGIGLEEAAQALILAFQGNTRLLKQFGIDVDEHASKETILASILQKVQGQTEAYSNTQKGAIDTLKQYGGEVMEAIGKTLGFRDAIVNVRNMVVKWIQDQGGLNAVLEKYQWLIALIAGLLVGVFVAGLVAAVVAMWPVIGAAVILGAKIGLIAAIIASVAAVWIMYWDQIKEGFGIVADWIVNKFNWLKDRLFEITDWIGSKIRGLVDTLESIGNKLISPVQSAGEQVGSWLENIWPFQHGGIVTRPTLGLVAEAGPEAIIPLNRLGGMGGGAILNIYLQGDFYTTEEIAEKFGNQIAKLIKYQLRI